MLQPPVRTARTNTRATEAGVWRATETVERRLQEEQLCLPERVGSYASGKQVQFKETHEFSTPVPPSINPPSRTARPALLGQAQITARSVAAGVGATASATKPAFVAHRIPVAASPGAIASATTSVQWSYMPAGQPLAAPNPSLKLSPNGVSPSPVWRYAVHFRQPGLGATPLVPA